MTSPFANFGARLREQGLAVMPCGPGTKFPGTYSAADGWRAAFDWQKYCDRLPSAFELDIWERWPDAGICLALGKSSAPAGMQLIAVDIDTEEPAIVAAIRAVLPGSPVRKRGAKGETEFYVGPVSVPNRPYNDGNKVRLLDLLGHGRQTVMPGTTHPDTGKTYFWSSADTLESFDIADLPVLPADIADRLSAALAPFGHEDAPVLAARDPDAEASTHRQLNDAALADLAAWVPALGLYRCRQVGGKYKAVSHWRPSSGGRPLAKRATNLAISPEGIKDCGEGKGYTPLDLVMAACDADLETAFRWLQERVAPAPVVTLSAKVPAEPPEAIVRTSPPGNLAGLRLVASDGVVVNAIQTAENHEEIEVVGNLALAPRPRNVEVEHQPLDLRDPAAWRDPPRSLFPEALIDTDPSGPEAASAVEQRGLADLCAPAGLVGELVDWMERSSDRPNRALLLGAALTLVGTLAGRRYSSPSNLRTNNYIVTLAPSGHGKDHALAQIKRLTEAARLDRYVGPARVMSASALRKLVNREPSVCCYLDEFGGFMAQIHDRRAGIHNTMIRDDMLEMFSSAGTFFAGAEYAGEPATKIYAPCFSINGTSTPAQFWASLSSMSAADGLLARMILLDVSGPKPIRRKPAIAPQDVPAALITALHQLADAGSSGNLSRLKEGSPETQVVPLNADAEEALDRFTVELDASEDQAEEDALPFINRAREHAIKLALTVAVGVSPLVPVIDGATMTWACDLARLSMRTLVREAADRIADNERAAAFNKVLGLIRSAGAKGITEGRIADRVRGLDKRMRDQILLDLQIAGRVRFERKASTGGRCGERYLAC